MTLHVVTFDRPASHLERALTILDRHLYDAIESQPGWVETGRSRRSCVLASLVARDFLRGCGFVAVAAPVLCRVGSINEDGSENWSRGVGDTARAPGSVSDATIERKDADGRGWDGHLVLLLPGHGLLVDVTLGQLRHAEYWPDLPDMIAAPFERSPAPLAFGLHSLSRIGSPDGVWPMIDVIWFDQPSNTSWQTSKDTRAGLRRWPLKVLRHASRTQLP